MKIKRRMLKKIAFCLILCWPLVAIVITGATNRSDAYADAPDRSPKQIEKADLVIDPPFVQDTDSKWVDSVFNTLTPDERIGQLFMVAAWSNKDKKHENEIT